MRNKFTQIMIMASVCLIFTGVSASNFKEGAQYKKLVQEVLIEHGDKIEVVELFWYGCSHCFRFEPHITEWIKNKPANVLIKRVPAIFNAQWALHARAYYTAEVLGVLDKIHEPIFDAIHKEKRHLRTQDALMAFFAKHGVDKEEFKNTFQSFSVDSKVRRALDLTRRYNISGVPTLIINGKFWTDASLSGGHKGMIKVLEFLVQQESAAKKISGTGH